MSNSTRHGAKGPDDRGTHRAARGYRWRGDFPDASPGTGNGNGNGKPRDARGPAPAPAPPSAPWLLAFAAGRRWRLESLPSEPGDDGRYWRAVEDRLEPGPELRAIVAELDDPDRGRPEPELRGLAAWSERGEALADDLAAELVRDLAAVGLLRPLASGDDGPAAWPAWTDREAWRPVALPEPAPGELPGLLFPAAGPYAASKGGR